MAPLPDSYVQQVNHRLALPANLDRAPCTLDDGNSCVPCEALDQLDDQLRVFLRRRRLIEEKINEAHDPFSRYLPVEVASAILTWAVEGTEDPFSVDEDAKFSKFSCSMPLILSAVCKRWRQIAFSTPKMWANINIYIYSESKIPVQTDLAREWLERSKNAQLPLEVSLFTSQKHFTFTLDESSLDDYLPLYGIIKVYASRWGRLNLILPQSTHYQAFFNGLDCLPCLRVAQVVSSEGSSLNLPKAPLLEDLLVGDIWRNVYDVKHWHQLSTLRLSNVGTDVILAILVATGRTLRRAIFKNTGGDLEAYDYPWIPYPHSELEDLEVHGKFVNAEFYEGFETCSLKRLVVAAPVGARPLPVNSFLSFLNRSQCSLSIFQLEGPTDFIKSSQLLVILKLMPTITRLSLSALPSSSKQKEAPWVTDKLFEEFEGGADSDAPLFLPHLRELKISSARNFSWESVLDALITLSSEVPRRTAESNTDKIKIRINLTRTARDDYIDPKVLKHLAKCRWDKISLEIFARGNRDFIQSSMQHHGVEYYSLTENRMQIT